MTFRFRVLLLLLLCPAFARADEPAKKSPATAVPFQRTLTQHVMVRAKINGKGPYNFIVDTGAPIMFVSVAVGKKIGLDSPGGWATLDKLEIEGGVVLNKVACRVETPFQLEGMNGMGLAGAELHGIIGYTVLAKYRMEIDFAKEKMTWTPLDFKPPPPLGIGGGGAPAGLEMIGTLMKFLGYLSGAKLDKEPAPRGFLGIELAEKDKTVTVSAVLDKSPAKEAGLKTNDELMEINGKSVSSLEDVRRHTAQATVGTPLRLTIRRGKDQQEVRLTTAEGL